MILLFEPYICRQLGFWNLTQHINLSRFVGIVWLFLIFDKCSLNRVQGQESSFSCQVELALSAKNTVRTSIVLEHIYVLNKLLAIRKRYRLVMTCKELINELFSWDESFNLRFLRLSRFKVTHCLSKTWLNLIHMTELLCSRSLESFGVFYFDLKAIIFLFSSRFIIWINILILFINHSLILLHLLRFRLFVFGEQSNQSFICAHIFRSFTIISLKLVVSIVHEKDLDDLVVLSVCSYM